VRWKCTGSRKLGLRFFLETQTPDEKFQNGGVENAATGRKGKVEKRGCSLLTKEMGKNMQRQSIWQVYSEKMTIPAIQKSRGGWFRRVSNEKEEGGGKQKSRKREMVVDKRILEKCSGRV